MPPEPMPPAPAIEANRSARILIVDDDPLFLDLATDLLTGAGHAVTGAASGAAAERSIAAAAAGFDLVLLDCGLSGPSELWLMDELQRAPVPPRILIVSARRGDWHKRVMKLYGAADYCEKPVSPAHLLRVVEQHLAQTRQAHG